MSQYREKNSVGANNTCPNFYHLYFSETFLRDGCLKKGKSQFRMPKPNILSVFESQLLRFESSFLLVHSKWGRRWWWIPGFMLPNWEIWIERWASGFRLDQIWLFQAFGMWMSRGRFHSICLCVSKFKVKMKKKVEKKIFLYNFLQWYYTLVPYLIFHLRI